MMRRSFIVVGILMIVLVLTFLIPACHSKGGGDNSTTTSTDSTAVTENIKVAGSMTAIADGKNWIASSVTANYNDNGLVITGTDDEGSTIKLEIGDDPIVGIFPIRKGRLQAASILVTVPERSTYYSPFNNTTGTINISYIDDDKVVGTFSFTGTNVHDYVIVEEGSFTAPISKTVQ